MHLTWLIAFPIVLVLLWLAWRRPNRKRMAVRLLASMVAGISLVLFVYPPVIKKATDPSTAILLTEGFNQDTIKALLKKDVATPHIYTLGTEAKKAIPLTDLYTLRLKLPALKTVHVVGYGLENVDLEALEAVQVVPHLTATPPGVQSVQWPQSIKLGEAVTITGKYKKPKNNKSVLYLNADGKLQDSVTVSADTVKNFRLKYVPKTTGRYVYTVLAKTGTQTDTLGQVPVQVNPVQKLSILLIASSPSFEFKFLKNHLAAQQHKVAYKATVSRDISQTEWVNMPKTDINRITPALLNKFDVLITEPQALLNMSTNERTILQRAVTENGLGILTIASEPATNRSTTFFTGFQTKRLSQQVSRSTRLNWLDKTETIQIASPYALAQSPVVSALVSEQKNTIIVGSKRAGWGKVALSYLPQTFQWKLEGKESIYSSYWTNLLSEIAKEQVYDAFWQLEKPLAPHPDKPLTLTFTDYAEPKETPLATMTSLQDSVITNLSLAQHLYQTEKYNTTFWARQSGWYQVKTDGVEPYYFYVQDSSDWKFESIANRKAATQEFVADQNSIPAKVANIIYHEEPVPIWWFFVVFILSSGFLWLEEKF